MNTTFLRHGDARARIGGDPQLTRHLTDEGREQCMRAAEELPDKKFDLVVTSTYPRTYQTAASVLLALEHPLDYRLVAIPELGDLGDDLPIVEEVAGKYADKGLGAMLREDGGAFERYAIRALDALLGYIYEFVEDQNNGNVLVVGHDPLFAALAYYVDRVKHKGHLRGLESNRDRFLRLKMTPASGFRVSTDDEEITFFGGCG